MPVTLEAAHRAEGLIFLDPLRTAEPGTHVLIVGCGRFHANSGLDALTSPGHSARALAKWFLPGGGFNEPRRPLASLSLLLSEKDDGTLSEAEGGTVPRARFAAVQAAMEGLRARAEVRADNLMVIYFASHGLGHEDRTGIIFEDHDPKAGNWLAGMTETDQLARALRRVKVDDKLAIFDCCRNEAKGIDSRDYLGLPLINPGPVSPLPAPAIALRSTISGALSYGFEDGLTLFGDALLKALGGLAARSNERWTVDTSSLKWVAGKLLDLRKDRTSGKSIQIPDVDQPGEFILCKSAPTNRVSVYLSVAPPHSGAPWRLFVTGADGQPKEAKAEWAGAAHVRLELEDGEQVVLRLTDKSGTPIAETAEKFHAPAAFPDIGTPYDDPPVQERSRSAGTRGPQDGATFSVRAAGGALVQVEPAPPPPGEVPLRGPGEAPPRRRSVGPDRPLDLEPGRYRVSVTGLDGQRRTMEMELAAGDKLALRLPLRGSPHEFLAGAAAAGVLPPEARRDEGAAGPSPVLRLRLGRGPLPLDHWDKGPAPARAELIAEGANPRFQVFRVKDGVERRFPSKAPASLPEAHPLWVEAMGKGWREIAVLPALGAKGWQTELLVDAEAPPRARLVPFVIDPDWTALLAFLGRRDFPSTRAALDQLYASNLLLEAVLDKLENPLAAAAGVLAAVAVGPIERAGLQEDWLKNLTNLFTGLPDGPVALGRHHERKGDVESARAAYRLALSRGVPVFSLAVDWLAEGLEALGDPGAAEALRWSRLADSLRTFTVLRMETA